MKTTLAFLAASCLTLVAGQDRAQDIVARAREAIGGQARLAAVRSLSAKGSGRLYTPVSVKTGSSTNLDDQMLNMNPSLDLRHFDLRRR